MGSNVTLRAAPRFSARAIGSFVQQPGCPAESEQALSPERLAYLCHGQCYNPGDERHRISKIEVVRIRPQAQRGEPVTPLIEDPWRGFRVPSGSRRLLHRVRRPGLSDRRPRRRLLRARSPGTDAGGERREPPHAVRRAGPRDPVTPCHGDPRTPSDDDCLAPVAERAWSSPIYVDSAASARAHYESNHVRYAGGGDGRNGLGAARDRWRRASCAPRASRRIGRPR